MLVRKNKLKIFYHDGLSPLNYNDLYTNSPNKPREFVNFTKQHGIYDKIFETTDSTLYKNLTDKDFLEAHTRNYYYGFKNNHISHRNLHSMNWSEDFVKTVIYTNNNLYNAIREAIIHPEYTVLSPTSGFHHAQPSYGDRFCTFSGQVIASIKIYKELGLSGCYFDLDGHFGDSIESARSFNDKVSKAIPENFNINPSGKNSQYYHNFRSHLQRVRNAIINGDIHYIVWCHGVDSWKGSDLTGGQCSMKSWLQIAKEFYDFIQELDSVLPEPVPVICCFFGGYHKQHPELIYAMHAMDLINHVFVMAESKDYDDELDAIYKKFYKACKSQKPISVK